MWSPNNMVVTPGNSALIVAEAYRNRSPRSTSTRTVTCHLAGCGPFTTYLIVCQRSSRS